MNHLYLFDKQGRASAYGIGTYIRNVVSACQNSSMLITVVYLLSTSDKQCIQEKDGIRYIYIPDLDRDADLNDKKDRKKFSLYIISVLQKFVSDADTNIFHLNYTQDYYLAESLKEHWSFCQLVVTVHYFTWCFALFGNVCRFSRIVTMKKEDLSDFEKEVIYSALFEQKLLQIADSVICLSDFARQILIGCYDISENKIQLITNGQKDLWKESDKRLLRRQYGIAENEKMLLFVGRLDNIKGVEYLIEAFKKVAQAIPDAHLYLIGDGCAVMYREMCAPMEERFTFCGRFDPNRLANYYRMSDVGVIPSLHEQCSYVAIEMMMYGLPMIGTDSTGLDEMIEEGVNGFKVKLQEATDRILFPIDELVSKILYCLRLPSLENLSYQSRTIYLQRYSIQKMQERLCRLYTVLFQK